MQMLKDDIKRFPALRYYVSINMPEVRKVNSILNAISTLSGTIDMAKLKKALLWGQGPVIKVVKNLGAFGEFTPNSSSNEIRIDEDLVKEFEQGGRAGLRKTPKGQLVYLVGVTLLHELTHWADDQDSDDFTGGVEGEEGDEFERVVYGGVIDNSHRLK